MCSKLYNIVNALNLCKKENIYVFIIASVFIIGGFFKIKIILTIFMIRHDWILDKFGEKGLQLISIAFGILLFLVGITI